MDVHPGLKSTGFAGVRKGLIAEGAEGIATEMEPTKHAEHTKGATSIENGGLTGAGTEDPYGMT